MRKELVEKISKIYTMVEIDHQIDSLDLNIHHLLT